MSKLSRFIKKNKKTLLTAGRVLAAGLTRGKSEKVVQNLKGVGAAVKVYKGLKKQATKAEGAIAAKIGALTPPKIVGISSTAATVMPGGAKLKGVSTSSAPRRKKAAATAIAKPPRTAKPRSSGKKRTPPKGGLDLKGLSASWAKAGKPGKWIDWVKGAKGRKKKGTK